MPDKEGDTPGNRAEQLRHEIASVINRYGDESDLTVCEVLGVLELIKAEWLERMRQSSNNRT